MLRMAQLNLRLFISASYNPSSLIPIRRVLPLLLFKPKTHLPLPSRPLSTVTAAGRGGYQRVDKFRGGIPLRKNGTPENTAGKKMSSPAEKTSSDMTEGEPKGFNMKRAEGLDKAGPKELKLKTRQINPVNTTCYVQILGTGMYTHDTSPSVLLFFLTSSDSYSMLGRFVRIQPNPFSFSPDNCLEWAVAFEFYKVWPGSNAARSNERSIAQPKSNMQDQSKQ